MNSSEQWNGNIALCLRFALRTVFISLPRSHRFKQIRHLGASIRPVDPAHASSDSVSVKDCNMAAGHVVGCLLSACLPLPTASRHAGPHVY